MYEAEMKSRPLKTMKKTFLFLFSVLLVLNSFAQDKYLKIPGVVDPSYQYIKQYGPEYYYEEFEPKSDRKSFASKEVVEVKVRVLRNYTDNVTFSFFILQSDHDWETLYVDEIDSLIAYLERIQGIVNSKKKPEDINYIYNSKTGIFFKMKWINLSTPRPLWSINISFPDGIKVIIDGKRQLEDFISKLRNGKNYLPAEESDFIFKNDPSLDKEWEMKDVPEVQSV